MLFFVAGDVLPDRLHQVRLAQSDPAVNEKRVVGACAGDCATARLAACAISLFGPTTNVSKLLRGLRPSALARLLAAIGVFADFMGSLSVRVAHGVRNRPRRRISLSAAPKTEMIADCKACM